MAFQELILKLEEIPILLNILYHLNNHNFTIYSYLIGEELFKASINVDIKVNTLLDRSRYNRALDKISNFENFNNIIPPFKILRRVLLSSGLWKMGNWTDLLETLREVRNRNPLKGDRIALIGMDTNGYIFRIYSAIARLFKDQMSQFAFVLSKLVQYELSSMQKIDADSLNSLKDAVGKDEEILSEFWNQDTLETRIKHIGLVEYNKLRTNSICFCNENSRFDGRDHDLQIIEDLTRQVESGYDFLLISCDRQFYDRARNPGIISQHLQIPPPDIMPQSFTTPWKPFCDFIYLLSVFFGAISLRGSNKTVQIFGIWRGKKTTDWDSESVKIRIGSNRLYDAIKKQLEIIEG